MRLIGRSLQVFGLVVLPVSMVLQLQNTIGAGPMLLMMVFGAAAFYMGRILEGYGRS
ncbi:MAG: hypothetical protein K2Y37_05480 [Pirellulales bacterium]|nr:hypothetical protein [Pirellulales bacterium]